MSNWTHVAGVIRIDSLRLVKDEDKNMDFDKLIGRECLWESDKSVWEDLEMNPSSFMPFGSEGTLQKSVWVNPDKCCAASYTVTIFGDLRDHDDPSEIIEWFKKVCDKFWIRNAVITACNEKNGTMTYTYKEDENV